MRIRRRRLPVEQVLLAGTFDDLDGLEMVLSLLSPAAYGQVLLEVPFGAELPELQAPPRVTIHPVTADAMRPEGSALNRAFAAWVGEWAPDEPTIDDRPMTIWIGAHAQEHVVSHCIDIDQLIEHF